jgi:hypothetical protein
VDKFDFSKMKICAIAGKGGAGKDTLHEAVLKPRGYLRWQMTLHFKVFLVSTGRFTWEEVFYTKPPKCRKSLQEEITEERYRWSEKIWLETFKNWMRALNEIVGVDASRVAITDARFLIEMAGIKEIGGKILHIEAADQQENIAPELRGHRSEIEIDSPEFKELRDAHIYNRKDGIDKLHAQALDVLWEWGWWL